MIIMIGEKFHNEYKVSKNWFSPRVFYKSLCAFVTSLFGMFMFFMVFHFWTMKLPIDLVFDTISLFKSTGYTENGDKKKDTMRRLMNHINFEQFSKDYQELEKVDLGQKLLYPFTSPCHVVLCFFYGLMYLGFGICLFDGPDGSWVISIYIVAAIIAVIVNLYAFLIVLRWLIIFLGTLMLFAFVLACLFICACTSSSSNSSNTSYI